MQYEFEIKTLNSNNFALYLKSKNESFDNIRDEIFKTENKQLCSNIKKNLNESINKILCKNDYVIEYMESKKTYENDLKSFISILKILMHKTSLMNEKKWFKITCDLVKPQL